MSQDLTIVDAPKNKLEVHTLQMWIANKLENGSEVISIEACSGNLASILKTALISVPAYSISKQFSQIESAAAKERTAGRIDPFSRFFRRLGLAAKKEPAFTAAYEIYKEMIHLTLKSGASDKYGIQTIDNLVAEAAKLGLHVAYNGNFLTKIESDPKKSPEFLKAREQEKIVEKFATVHEQIASCIHEGAKIKNSLDISWKDYPSMGGFVIIITYLSEDYGAGYQFVNANTEAILKIARKCSKDFVGIMQQKTN